MAQVFLPPQQSRERRAGREGSGRTGRNIGAALGAVAGGVTGGPGGAVQGALMGSQLGGLAGGAIDPGRAASVTERPTIQAVQPTGAVARRLSVIDEDPDFTLQKAEAALARVDPAVRERFGSTITDARQILAAQRKQQRFA